MNDKPSTPVTQRRTFILGALGAAALGFVGVTFKHQYFASQSEPGDMARIKATVLVFIGAMFGRVLVGEDRADMSDRLDLFFASSAGLRHEARCLPATWMTKRGPSEDALSSPATTRSNRPFSPR